MNITKKGIFWELLNSLWIVLSFWGLPWAAFFYIGKTARNKKWQLYAALYLVFQIVCFIACTSLGFIGTLGAAGIVAGYMIGLVHSFLVRREYLITKEYIITSGIQERDDDRLRENVRRNFERKEEPAEEVILEDEPFVYDDYLYSDDMKINLNISTKEELLALPGVNSEIAEKAINFRKKFGGFASTKEFVEILQIDNRYLSEIQKKATVK